ncbi:MAG TPA: flagellar biosynthesis protein FlhA [Candidatus Binatia bacterium]|jgi:flagellar biosynthesis protein FlhA
MTQTNAQNITGFSLKDAGPAVALVAMLMLLLLPVPSWLLDFSLVISIACSLTILMVSFSIKEPLEFAAFPTVLLFVTLLRLGLNVASARLVLLHGEEGSAAAGRVIEAFGQFVMGGNYAVGFIVFVILTVINFVVITKGATRIAEVAARFTLDAMPGKQMAIDADLNAGLINDADAKRRRERVQREADFYGAMDGASKFVRGDAVAGLIILAVNLLGGFFVGVMQKGLSITDAAHLYTLLSIGDGLVAQVPAIIVSTAAGLVVTRTASEAGLGVDLAKQLLWNPKVLGVVAGALGLLAFVPGFPALPFLATAMIAGGLCYTATDKEQKQIQAEAESQKPPKREEAIRPVPIDLLELEVGYELIPLIDSERGGLVERIKALRRQLLTDRGFLIPQIHIRDNLRLGSKQYTLLIKGVEAGKGELRPGKFLAMSVAAEVDASSSLPGDRTEEPAFGLPALWISAADKERAEGMGYTVVDSETVLITHLSEIVKRYSADLLTRQDVQRLLDELAKEHPKVIEELIPQQLTLGGVQKVLQNLLREEVPIRDLLTIVETLADYAPQIKDMDQLTEHVRQGLARVITAACRNAEGVLPVMTVDLQIERTIRESVQENMALEPQAAQRIITAARQAMDTFTSRGLLPVFLTSPDVRRHLRQLLSHYLKQIVVLSHREITDGVKIQSLGVIR